MFLNFFFFENISIVFFNELFICQFFFFILLWLFKNSKDVNVALFFCFFFLLFFGFFFLLFIDFDVLIGFLWLIEFTLGFLFIYFFLFYFNFILNNFFFFKKNTENYFFITLLIFLFYFIFCKSEHVSNFFAIFNFLCIWFNFFEISNIVHISELAQLKEVFFFLNSLEFLIINIYLFFSIMLIINFFFFFKSYIFLYKSANLLFFKKNAFIKLKISFKMQNIKTQQKKKGFLRIFNLN